MSPERDLPTPAAGLDELVEMAHRHVVDHLLDPETDREAVLAHVRSCAPLLSAHDETTLLARLSDRVAGLGPLAPLLADDAATDVLVNGPGRVWIERSGDVQPTEVVLDEPEIRRIVERLVAPTGRRVDRRNPLVDLRLHDGSRAHVALPPVAVDGPYVTIRRFRRRAVAVADFAPRPVAELVRAAVRARANILVSGGTGTGKTTLLNALCSDLPSDARVVTVEDAAELALPGDHVVRLETRPASVEGVEGVTVADLVRASLRMRPDRIIVGEVRGAEARDMLDALNTGHAGSMTTCHANTATDALDRLELMVLAARDGLDAGAVRRRIHAAFDLVVHLERAEHGKRRIRSVVEPATRPDTDPAIRVLAKGSRVLDTARRPAGRPAQ